MEQSDIPLLLRWHSDPAALRCWGDAAALPTRHELERDLARRVAAHDTAIRFIVETFAGQPIGWLNVEQIDDRHRSATVTLSLGDLSADAQGYSSDALSAACRYLFCQRGLRRISLTVKAEDDPAITVYETLGFHREGTLRGHHWVNGTPVDEIAMSLLAGELRDAG